MSSALVGQPARNSTRLHPSCLYHCPSCQKIREAAGGPTNFCRRTSVQYVRVRLSLTPIVCTSKSAGSRSTKAQTEYRHVSRKVCHSFTPINCTHHTTTCLALHLLYGLWDTSNVRSNPPTPAPLYFCWCPLSTLSPDMCNPLRVAAEFSHHVSTDRLPVVAHPCGCGIAVLVPSPQTVP